MTIIFFLFFLMGNVPAQAQGESKSITELISLKDYLRYSRLKISPCSTPNPPYVGVRFQYWEPSLFMETVKAPGDYVIREAGALLGQGLKSLGKGKTSISSFQAVDGANLQFNEVHLYDFPLKAFQETVMCPATFGDNLMVRYLSELNGDFWRRKQAGFLIHFSSLVASATTCVRAVHAIGASSYTVLDKIQMVYPHRTEMIPQGTNMSLYDGFHSKDGRYVWIYWRYRDCCRTVSG